MPLVATADPAMLDEIRDGVVFNMRDGFTIVSVLVSHQALEDVDSKPNSGGNMERLKEYRAQFERIASDKYDRGHLELDGTVCVRGRDLPGRGQ